MTITRENFNVLYNNGVTILVLYFEKKKMRYQ